MLFRSHAYALLSFGLMDQAKDTVLCPLHGWRIGLADGQIQFPAQTGMSVCTFPVRVSAGLIEVNIAGCAKAPNSGDGAAAANSLN